LIQNSAEGPAYDRCQIEVTLASARTAHWLVFFGEAHADSNSGWAAIRAGSGCAPAGSEPDAAKWTLRGFPYFLVDVSLGQARVAGREILLEGAFSVRKRTGFSQAGVPAHEQRTEKRTLRVPEGGSAVVPILAANEKETEQFGVRELILRFRAGTAGSRAPAEYGEIAVTADVPRAEIFLDGGLVGRTSYDGPVTLGVVRAGEREIVVRDASGREARSVAKVQKGRQTRLLLTLLRDSPASSGGLRPLGRNPQGSEEFWREKDGAVVVRIPGGEFQMGSPEGEGEPPERPRHLVRVNGFLMDKTEVSWGQYLRFAKESNRPLPKVPIFGMTEELPATNVTWYDAGAFCGWAGGRLPTEAEWERAARGDDSRQYPWGNQWEPWRCNTRDGGPHGPTAAGSYPDCAGPYGVLDLAGSVAEWCSDRYDEAYYGSSPVENPLGPAIGMMRVSRGGAWMSPFPATRGASRQGNAPASVTAVRGFRCVMDDPMEKE
jgi:formylglycine-generating enzyme required for sulfatase activity